MSKKKRRTKRRGNLGYYIKEGVSSIFTHGFMSFASVVIIIACLVIMGSFLLIAINVNDMIDEMENRNQIQAFIDPELTESEARGLEGRILADPNVEETMFINRDAAWERFTANYDPGFFDGIENHPLRDRFLITLEDIGEMAATEIRLLQIEGVASINAHTEIADWFVTFRNVIAIIFLAIVGVLFIISIFIIANTIKLATFDRREEIAIMRMVGATNWFIRWPFIFQGFILGLTGAVFAFGLQWALYEILAVQVMGLTEGGLIRVISFSTVADAMLIVFMGTGFVVGTLGSAIAIRNYLKV